MNPLLTFANRTMPHGTTSHPGRSCRPETTTSIASQGASAPWTGQATIETATPMIDGRGPRSHVSMGPVSSASHWRFGGSPVTPGRAVHWLSRRWFSDRCVGRDWIVNRLTGDRVFNDRRLRGDCTIICR